MKLIKSLTVGLCAVALLASLSIARAEDKKEEKKACCEATVEAGKKCDHACCKKAAEAGKTCKKCHKDEKKAEKKAQ
jgi:hypothetical protein